MDLDKIKNSIEGYLEAKEMYLYEIIIVKEYGYQVLRISVDYKKGGIDVDTLAVVSEYISSVLDGMDIDMDNYMLEVCSPGAEKTLRNKEEVMASVGEYINVKLPEMTYEGYLESFQDDVLTIKINIKGRNSLVEVNYNEIKKIRLAVKC